MPIDLFDDRELSAQAFLNQSPALIFIKDTQGRYLHVNDQFVRSFGLPREDILGRTDDELFPGAQAQQFRDNDIRAMVSGMTYETEETAQYTDGVHTSIVSKFPVYEADGQLVAVGGIVTDITQRKFDEASLLESRALLAEAERIAHLGCWQWHQASGRLLWSDEMYRIFGVDMARFRPSLAVVMQCVHEADRAMVEFSQSELLRTGQPSTTEQRIVRPNGDVRHTRFHSIVVRDEVGGVDKVLGTCLDITEQKRTEEALHASAEQLQLLSQRLVEIQERERRDLSREFHDRVGQNLTALSLNLAILRRSLVDTIPPELLERLDDSVALVDQTADTLDNILADLRPPMLDDYGLRSALQWLARAFQQRFGIDTEVTPGPDPVERMSSDAEIGLFRIAQEALNNAAKHAKANRIQISLRTTSQSLMMTVVDDGVGFDVNAAHAPSTRRGIGMATMHERAQALGGNFAVRSAVGKGTQIVAWIPLAMK